MFSIKKLTGELACQRPLHTWSHCVINHMLLQFVIITLCTNVLCFSIALLNMMAHEKMLLDTHAQLF